MVQTNAVGTPEQVVHAFGYDSENHLCVITNALGAAEQVITEYTYTAEHKVNAVTRAKGMDEEVVTNYDYRSLDGLLERKSEGNGRRITLYSYHVYYGTLIGITSTDAGTLDFDYNYRDELVSSTDARDARTEYTYDANSRLLETLFADGTTVSNSFWKNGLPKTTTDQQNQPTRYYWTPAHKMASVVFPNGGNITNIYDAADRLTITRDAEGSWTTNVLDAVGRVASISTASTVVSNEYDAVGNLVKSTIDPEGWSLWAQRTYDSQNRLSSRQTAAGTEQFAYDVLGRQTNMIDAVGNSWGTQYDALGRIQKTHRPAGDFEEYGYDALGNRTHFWNAERNTMTYGFDDQSRMTSYTNALGNVWRYFYDDNGNLTQTIDGRGTTLTYGYDLMNRLSSDTGASYCYDANGNLIGFGGSGGWDDVQVGFVYNEMNQIISCAQTNPVTTSSMVFYGYDKAGNRTNIVYPGGLEVDYVYDTDNRVVNLTTLHVSGTNTSFFGYDSASRPIWTVYPNETESRFYYDVASRIRSFSMRNIHHGTFYERDIFRNAQGYKISEEYVVGLEPAIIEGQQLIENNIADQMIHIDQRDTWLGGELNQWYDLTGHSKCTTCGHLKVYHLRSFISRLFSPVCQPVFPARFCVRCVAGSCAL